MGHLKILNGIKLILDDQGNHLDSYTISLKSFRAFRGPLFCKPATDQELFLAVSYSKQALIEDLLGGSLSDLTLLGLGFGWVPDFWVFLNTLPFHEQ